MKNNRNPPPIPVVQKVMAVLTTGRTVRAVLAVGMLLLLAVGLSKPATAQGRLDARYAATLGGLPIGRGAWVIDISDDHYTAAASGMTAGIMRIFASGQGTTAARGNIAGGNLLPVSYASNVKTEEKSEDVRMTLRGLNITEFSVTPPAPPNPAPVYDGNVIVFENLLEVFDRGILTAAGGSGR